MASRYYSRKNQPTNHGRKKVFIFGTLRYWMEHATLLGMALAGLGHYSHFVLPALCQVAETDRSLQPAPPKPVCPGRAGKGCSTAQSRAPVNHPNRTQAAALSLRQPVELVSLRDTQYTLQVEEVSLDSDLYQLRLERNLAAARAAFSYLRKT